MDIEPAPSEPTNDQAPARPDYTMGMLCHLLSLTLFLGVPLGNILGPLIVWLSKRKEDPFVDQCGKDALNFQISVTIYLIISGFLILVVVGMFLMVVVMILNLVYTLIAATKASKGIPYQYPLSFRFLK